MPAARSGAGWNQYGDEGLDSPPDLIPDRPHGFDSFANGVLEHPVLVVRTGVERAGVAAAHGNHDVRGLDGFSGEDFRLLRGDVDADLGHGGYRYPEPRTAQPIRSGGPR